jgi:hypothetical protein
MRTHLTNGRDEALGELQGAYADIDAMQVL